jgi:DNA-binding transcriptional LysR family regulator
MELRHLRYFVAVAEELHFRRAAERLHVAQPAVSEQVRKLEQELGVTLLERTPRCVSLTDAGAAMLDEARGVLRLAEGAQLAARNARDRATVRLRIGYTAASLPAAVPRALQAIRSQHKCEEITLRSGAAAELIQAVRDERIEAAVVPLPAPVGGLRVMQLNDQHAVAALPVRHPHAGRASISLRQVAPERLRIFPREANRPFYDAILAACHQAGLSPALLELPHNDVEQALLDVISGAGMALLPDSVAERYAAPGARFLPLDDPRPAFAIGVVTRRDSEHLACDAFLRALARISYLRPPTAPQPALSVAA